MPDVEYLVIGAGIAGAAVAAHLSQHAKVLVLEAEAQAGYHSTGRSAALFTVNYGPETVRRINQLGLDFMSAPPKGFCADDKKLLTPAGFLGVAGPDDEALLETTLQQFAAMPHEVERLDANQVMRYAPMLRSNCVAGGYIEKGVSAIDVDAVHQGFLRQLVRNGGALLVNQCVSSLSQSKGHWMVGAGKQQFSARNIINAAGAWASEVGQLAGATDIALVPKRRTALMMDLPPHTGQPLAVEFLGQEPYLKISVGQIMASLGEQSAVAAQDVQPEEIDIARIVDWLERHTVLNTTSIGKSWAGLRSFVADDCPVIGADPLCERFYWLAGQGGFGIMMSEPLGRACADLIIHGQLPQDFKEAGIDAQSLSAARFSTD